jgi:hypothetical protein
MSAYLRNARAFGLACGLAALSCTDSTAPEKVDVASVSVTVPRSAIRVGEKIQAAAIPLDASGGVLTGREVTWASSDNDVASVSTGGLISALKPGAVTITATVEGKNGTTSVAVSLVPVATITIDPPAPTISAGTSTTLTATLKDSAGNVITGRTVTWSTTNAPTAAVTQAGVVTGMLVGTADIVASIEGKQAKATVTVNTTNTPVATISLTPATATMSGGAKKQLTTTLNDAYGNVLTRTVTYTSNNNALATVSASGEVTSAPGDGSVVITASIEGKSATTTLEIVTFVRMSAGIEFTCGLNAEGTAYCWGDNFNSELGNGGTVNSASPTKVSTDLKFVSITSGQAHTCALTSTGVPYCWGDNTWGQLGSGVIDQDSRTPAAVNGGYSFTSIAAGQNSTCGTTFSLDVYCWGESFPSGQFGPIQPNPKFVGSGIVAIVGAPTTNKYCGVDAGGLAYCWTPDFVASAPANQIPPAVSTSVHFSTLRVASTHVCGVATSGQVYCWGKNDSGELGDGTTVDKANPTPVASGLLFESVAVGSGGFVYPNDSPMPAGYSCGVARGGKGYCWGVNIIGQLGRSTTGGYFTVPQPVAGGLTFSGIRAGSVHTCGLTSTGAAYCWGSNSKGQLGDGTDIPKDSPSLVFGN